MKRYEKYIMLLYTHWNDLMFTTNNTHYIITCGSHSSGLKLGGYP